MNTETGEIRRIVGEIKPPWIELTEARARELAALEPGERLQHHVNDLVTLEYTSVSATQGIVGQSRPTGLDLTGQRCGSKMLRQLQRRATKGLR